MEGVRRFAVVSRPPLRIFDFVEDLRLVEACVPKIQLFVGMIWLMDLLSMTGVRFRIMTTGWRWPV